VPLGPWDPQEWIGTVTHTWRGHRIRSLNRTGARSVQPGAPTASSTGRPHPSCSSWLPSETTPGILTAYLCSWKNLWEHCLAAVSSLVMDLQKNTFYLYILISEEKLLTRHLFPPRFRERATN
jgi:hypothetical protein